MLSYLNQFFQKAEEHSHYPESEEKIFSDKIYLGKSFGKSSFENANCQYFGNFFIDSSKFSSKNFEKEIAGLIHQFLKSNHSSFISEEGGRIDYKHQMELLGLDPTSDSPVNSDEEGYGIICEPVEVDTDTEYFAINNLKVKKDSFINFNQFLAYTRIMPKAWVRLIFSTLNNRNAREFINLINDIILEVEDNEFVILAKNKEAKNITKHDLPSFSNYKPLRDAIGILRSKKNKNKLASALELFQNSEVNYKMLEAIIYQVFFVGKEYDEKAYKSIAIDALNSGAFLLMKKNFYCSEVFKRRRLVGFEHLFNSILNPDFSSKGYGRNIVDYLNLEQKDSKKYNYIDFFLKTESSIFGQIEFYKKDSFCNLRNPIENNFALFKIKDNSNEKDDIPDPSSLNHVTSWDHLFTDNTKWMYFEDIFQYCNLNDQEIWNKKHQELVKLLKSVFADRNIEIYNLLATYITSMISILSIINFDEYFEDVYKKANKIVIFEGADGVGKSSLINLVSRDLKNKMDEKIESLIEDGKYSVVDHNTIYPNSIVNPFELSARASNKTKSDNLFDVRNVLRCPLSFFGYNNIDDFIYQIRFHSDHHNSISKNKNKMIEDLNLYKSLRPSSFLSKHGTSEIVGDIDARQLTNLSNMIVVNKMSMDLTFANHKKFEYNIVPNAIYSKLYGENGDDICKVGHKTLNYNSILLQDRSFLSTLVYSIDINKILEKIFRNVNDYDENSKNFHLALFDIFTHVLNIENDTSGKLKGKKDYKFFKHLSDHLNTSTDSIEERKFIIDSTDFYDYILDRWAISKNFSLGDSFDTTFANTLQYYLNDKNSKNFYDVNYWNREPELYSDKNTRLLYNNDKRRDVFNHQYNSLIELYSEIVASQKRSTQLNVNCGNFIDSISFILTRDFEAGKDFLEKNDNKLDFFEDLENSYCKISISFQNDKSSLAKYMIKEYNGIFLNSKYTFIIDANHFRNYVYKRLYNIFENFRFAAKDYMKKPIPRKIHNIDMNSHWGDNRVKEMLSDEVVEKIFDN